MKSGSAFLLSGIIILAIGIAWLFLGWTGSATVLSGLGPIPSVAETPVTVTPGPVSATPTLTQQPEPTLVPSQDAIRLHLIDLAFGEGNVKLLRWDPARNNGRIIISVNGGSSADIRNLELMARQFNSVSATNQISENIKQNSQGDLTIKFVPESGMNGISLNNSDPTALKEMTVDGLTAARIIPGSIYLNANLKGEVRSHTLIRSLYYTLGVVGDSDSYQDSLFSSGDNTNTNLTSIDLKAVELLYGKRLQPGLSASEVKEILYVK